MSSTTKTVLGVVIAAVVVLVAVYALGMRAPSQTATTTGDAASSLPTAASDSSDAALQQDAAAVDSQLTAVNSDSATVNQGIAEAQI